MPVIYSRLPPTKKKNRNVLNGIWDGYSSERDSLKVNDHPTTWIRIFYIFVEYPWRLEFVYSWFSKS